MIKEIFRNENERSTSNDLTSITVTIILLILRAILLFMSVTTSPSIVLALVGILLFIGFTTASIIHSHVFHPTTSVFIAIIIITIIAIVSVSSISVSISIPVSIAIAPIFVLGTASGVVVVIIIVVTTIAIASFPFVVTVIVRDGALIIRVTEKREKKKCFVIFSSCKVRKVIKSALTGVSSPSDSPDLLLQRT
jgi:hypothetical protein